MNIKVEFIIYVLAVITENEVSLFRILGKSECLRLSTLSLKRTFTVSVLHRRQSGLDNKWVRILPFVSFVAISGANAFRPSGKERPQPGLYSTLRVPLFTHIPSVVPTTSVDS